MSKSYFLINQNIIMQTVKCWRHTGVAFYTMSPKYHYTLSRYNSDSCAKNCQNRFTYVRVVARQSSDIFETVYFFVIIFEWQETDQKLIFIFEIMLERRRTGLIVCNTRCRKLYRIDDSEFAHTKMLNVDVRMFVCGWLIKARENVI